MAFPWQSGSGLGAANQKLWDLHSRVSKAFDAAMGVFDRRNEYGYFEGETRTWASKLDYLTLKVVDPHRYGSSEKGPTPVQLQSSLNQWRAEIPQKVREYEASLQKIADAAESFLQAYKGE